MTQQSGQALSTGMGNLDNKFERGGIHPGSVLAVQSPASALGQVVLYNLAAERPTTYISVGPCDPETEALLVEAGNLDPADLTVETLPPTEAPEALSTRLADRSFPAGSTILLEPTNLLERHTDAADYADLLSTLGHRVRDCDGLCGLLAVESDPVPDNRWLTLYAADTVLSVLHEVSNRTVHDHLALEKLHPRQDLRDDDRVFRLPRSLEIDIDTKQNLSP